MAHPENLLSGAVHSNSERVQLAVRSDGKVTHLSIARGTSVRDALDTTELRRIDFNRMVPSIAPWKRPQSTGNTRFPNPCARFWQIHHQGLVFRSVMCGVWRVPGAEPSRSESKSPVLSVTN